MQIEDAMAEKRTPTIFETDSRLRRACAEAQEWCGDRDARTAWEECPKADWLLWAAGRCGVDRRLLVLAACDCAEVVLKHTTDPRPAEAIVVARRWAKTLIDDDREAERAAAEARDAMWAAAEARGAMWTAAEAAARAAMWAAKAAARAERGESMWTAAEAAAREAALAEEATLADLVRARIPFGALGAPDSRRD